MPAMRQLSLYEAFAVDRPPLRRRAATQADDDDTRRCYVCHELTTETCQCACRATVHADCLLKCVRASGRSHCSICLGPIANLRVHRWRRVSRRLSVWLLATGAAVFYFSVSAAIEVGRIVEARDRTEFYRRIIVCVSFLAQSWGASRLFSWLVEKRDLTADHVEFHYG